MLALTRPLYHRWIEWKLNYNRFRELIVEVDRAFVSEGVFEPKNYQHDTDLVRFDMLFTLGLIRLHVKNTIKIYPVSYYDEELKYVVDDYRTVKMYLDKPFSLKKLMLTDNKIPFTTTLFDIVADALNFYVDSEWYAALSGDYCLLNSLSNRYVRKTDASEDEHNIAYLEEWIDVLEINSTVIDQTAIHLYEASVCKEPMTYAVFLDKFKDRLEGRGIYSTHVPNKDPFNKLLEYK